MPQNDARPLRVALTVPAFLKAPDFGGPVTKVALLAEGLALLGHDVTVVTADFGPNRSRIAAGTEEVNGYTVATLRTLFRYRWSPVIAPGQLQRLSWEFDIVHVCGLREGLGFSMIGHARRRGIPYVVEPLGMVPAQLRNVVVKTIVDGLVTRRELEGARAVIATSAVERQHLEAQFSLPRLHIRPNPVSIASTDPRPAPPIGGWVDVLFVGRICRTKGLLQLVQAVGPLENVRLTIAGPDDRDGTAEAVQAEVAQLPEDRVVFRGWVTPDERNELIAASHICVLPSVTENFGNFAVEAASARRPVIVTRTSGVAEFLRDAALVVEPTAEAIRAAIVQLSTDEALRASLAERGFQRAIALSPAKVAVLQEDIYREALRSSDPAS